jgi:hypothetical protein
MTRACILPPSESACRSKWLLKRTAIAVRQHGASAAQPGSAARSDVTISLAEPSRWRRCPIRVAFARK